MEISSPMFEDGAAIPKKYTCDGENINPPLTIIAVPVTAKSLVLIVDDPDAPSGTFTHWTLWNIDPETILIDEDSYPPDAIQGVIGTGKPGYTGPCPPSGIHRYFFRLFALDTILDLPPTADVTQLRDAMMDHVIMTTEMVGTYARPIAQS